VAKRGELVAAITREFRAAADPKYHESIQRFFKESVKLYGVRTPEWRRISRQFWSQVKHLPKADVFALCEELLAIRNSEERGVAFDWAGRMRKHLRPADFPRLGRWLKLYVTNWGSCDSLCGGALGFFLLDHPEFLPKVRTWAGSKNRWLRRASAVAHIIPNRNGIAADSAYEVADVLLEDTDDMVQKGYGWLLKEIANKRPQEVFDFVMARKDRMPRTALRYATEKMPPAWKKRAMAK
jgi:3-methyladenine DNA glycosylase AlkD